MRYLIPLYLLLLCSCSRHQEDPTITQMRVRNLQTRTFVGMDAKTVMKEVISVLQDQGYIVKNVSQDLGLLTAELNTDIEKFASKFFSILFSGRQGRWKKHTVVELTSNVMEKGGNTKLRINFLARIFDNTGRVVDIHQILDEEAYQDFYDQVQKGLLYQSN